MRWFQHPSYRLALFLVFLAAGYAAVWEVPMAGLKEISTIFPTPISVFVEFVLGALSLVLIPFFLIIALVAMPLGFLYQTVGADLTEMAGASVLRYMLALAFWVFAFGTLRYAVRQRSWAAFSVLVVVYMVSISGCAEGLKSLPE